MLTISRIKKIARTLQVMQIAAWTYELYRLIRKPHTYGALVAIWQNNKLLMVQTSYRTGYGLPGGGLQASESALEAATRELKEELGLSIESKRLKNPWAITERSPGGVNTVTIFKLDWSNNNEIDDKRSENPQLKIDQLEVIAARWMKREEALSQQIPNHIRKYLEAQKTDFISTSGQVNDIKK